MVRAAHGWKRGSYSTFKYQCFSPDGRGEDRMQGQPELEQVVQTEARVINGVLISRAKEAVPLQYGARVAYLESAVDSEAWVTKEVGLPDGFSRIEGGIPLKDANGDAWYFPAVHAEAYATENGEDTTYIFFSRKEVAEIPTDRLDKHCVDLVPLNRTFHGSGEPAFTVSIRDTDSKRISKYLVKQLAYTNEVERWEAEIEKWRSRGCKGCRPLPPQVPDFNAHSDVKTYEPGSEVAKKLFPTANGVLYVKPSL